MANLNEFRPFLRSRDEKFRKTKFSLARIFFSTVALFQLTFYHWGHLFFTNHLSG